MGACLPKAGPRPQGGLSECCSTRSPRIPWEDYLVHDSEDADSRHTGAQSLALDSAWAYTPGQEATEGDLSAPLPKTHEDAGSSAPLPARRATEGVITEDDVPVWATEGIVFEHVKRHGGPRSLLQATASCIIWLQLAALVSIALQVSTYALGRAGSTCIDGRFQTGIWMWAPVLPAFVFRAFVEWKAVRHLALPVAKFGGDFKFIRKISFRSWLGLCGFLSSLNFGDLFSDSIFAASIGQKLTCGDHGQHLGDQWHEGWAHSAFGLVGFPAPDLGQLILLGWWLSLLQACMPLTKSLGACRTDVILSEFGQKMGEFDDCLGSQIRLDETAFELGDANGMATLAKLQIRLVRSIVESHRRDSARLMYAAPLGHVMRYKVVLTWILENAIQLNLQTTYLGLARRAATVEGFVDFEVPLLMSISFGLTTNLLKLYEAWEFWAIAAPVMEAVDRREYHSTSENFALRESLRRSVFIVLLGCCGLLFTLAYAAAKLVGAYVCPGNILNITGCVAVVGDG